MSRDVRELKVEVREVQKTLSRMASDEMVELRRRADFPRRLLFAVGAPMAAAVLAALILAAFGALHVT